MKKFVLATVLMLFGCTQVSSINVLSSIESVKNRILIVWICVDLKFF